MMTTKKHELSPGADNINGGSGKDLFKAPLINGAMTLNSTDVLDGGAGIDTIQASLLDGNIDPIMKSIERGIFTATGVANATIDLSHATAMSDLTFQQDPAHASATNIYLANAANVSSLTITKAEQEYVEMQGLDSTITHKLDVSVNTAADSTVALFGSTTSSFKRVDVHLDTSLGTTLESMVGVRQMVIHSDGLVGSALTVQPILGAGAIHEVKLVGTATANITLEGEANAQLQSFDSSRSYGVTVATLGGEHLHKVVNGDGTSYISLSEIGGSKHAPAEVNLGNGDDSLVLGYALDTATQHYNGGQGYDSISFEGQATHLNQLKSFELMAVDDAGGTYELKGTHLDEFVIESTTSATTLNHLSSATTVAFYEDTANYLQVNLAGNATVETLTLELDGATVGSQIAGLNAAGVSHLNITAYNDDNRLYLGNVGAASDPLSVTISGATHVSLDMANASTTQIDHIKIDDDAGVNLSGLVANSQVFAAGGVKIVGGDGNDVLVGGNGDDTIATGRGHNTVEGSYGADIVNLFQNSSHDTLIFNDIGQSGYGADHDTINHFGASDNIDLTALGTTVSFAANVQGMATGMADLSAVQATAFFDVKDHTLYIDLNHDKQFDSTHDMQIQLTGVDHFDSTSLLS